MLRAVPTNVPHGVSFYKRSGLVSHGAPAEFEMLAGVCPVFRLDPSAHDEQLDPSTAGVERRPGEVGRIVGQQECHGGSDLVRVGPATE